MNYFAIFLLFQATLANFHPQERNGSPLCYERWLEGYRLASGRPQKVLRGVTLRICEDECSNTRGCAAFAYGIAGEANGTCELATRTRDSRAANQTEGITLSDVDKSHQYDVYIEKAGDHCFKTSPLYGNPNSHAANGVPIDCFYRLMAGKRLSKIHVLKSVSVHSIQECQEACILERSFSCRSISYRYMPTGYTYSVSNCELSSYTETPHSVHDYIEDYDYDYFQREPHCKTTSSINSYGVCAVVVRRGGKLNPGLIKSSHSVNTMGKCEHLCATALFRCRAFSFRHTERGRENYFQRETDSCLLHDADIGRLPGHNIEANPDFDLYEMGRLMGAECILYDQYNRNRNGGIGHNYGPTGGPPDHRPPAPLVDNRNFDRPYGSNERHYPERNYPPSYNDNNRHYDYDRSRFNTNYPPPRNDYNSRPGAYNPRDGQSFHNSSGGHHQHHEGHPPSSLHNGPTPLPPPLPPINRNPDLPVAAFHNNRPIYMDTLDFHTHRPAPSTTYSPPSPPHNGQGHRPSDYPGLNNRPNSEFPGQNTQHGEFPGQSIRPPPDNYNPGQNNNNNRPSPDYPGPGNFHSYDTHGEFPPHRDVNPLRGPPPPPPPPSSSSHNNNPAQRYPEGPENRNHDRYPDRNNNNYPEDRNSPPRYPDDKRYNPPRYPEERYPPPSSNKQSSSEAEDLDRYPKDRYPERYQHTALQISHQSNPIASSIPITTNNHHHQSESPTIQGVFGPPEGILNAHVAASSAVPKTDPPYYDKRREVCLVKLRDASLVPELSRATFPVKTIEECRIECIRSYDVLRFECKVMSFRLTSNSGGSCQLSDQDHRQFRESDFVPPRDRYEGASTYFYDDRDPICRQNGYSTYNDRYGSGYFGGSRNSGYTDSRYPTSGVNYNDRYYDSNRGRYGESRYSTGDNRYDDNYNRYGYFNQAGSYQGPSSSSNYNSGNRNYGTFSSGFTTSSNYGRYGSGGGGSNYGNYGNYPEYQSGSGHSTVNGERCLRSCRQNREAGFFYCQVDDQGSWDFCCRPDHFCGFSPGLSVSWCYVGTGPSQSIWRSCNHRYNDQKMTHNVAYLHEGPPPTIQKLSNNEVANLTKDNALLLFKASAPVFPEASSSNSEEQVVKTLMPPVILQSLQLEKKDDKLVVIKKEEVKSINGLNVTSAEESGNVTRSNRRTPRTPTFTIVDQPL